MERSFTCAEFEILLADWIDEALAAPARQSEREAFVCHLESCPACATLAEDARFAVGFMDRAAEVDLPPALVTKILAATGRRRTFSWKSFDWTFAPALWPRFAMGAAMTLISLAIIARGFGLSDVNPARVWGSLDNRTHRIWDRTVKSYETTPLVYEVSTQLTDWERQQQDDQP